MDSNSFLTFWLFSAVCLVAILFLNEAHGEAEIGSNNWLERDAINVPSGLFRKKFFVKKHLRHLLSQSHRAKKLRMKKSQRNLPRLIKRPNIILMMADDQDTELGSLQFMPKLNRYLKEEGNNETNIEHEKQVF